MKKSFLALCSALLAVFLLAGCATTTHAARGEAERTRDLPQISVSEAFEQEGDAYVVYFWRSACPFCQQFEPIVVGYWNEGLPVYVVNMDQNPQAWYDGSGFATDLMFPVGDVVDGELVMRDDYDLDHFRFEDGWESGADAEGVYWVRLSAAAQMNIDVTDYNDFAVQGTPTVVLIRDGRVANHGTGVDRAWDILEELAGILGMPGQVLPS